MKVAVVGGGVGGLAVAARLAALKWEVHLFEKNDYIGGKLGVFEQNGYRFDKGPSLFTLPELMDELFQSCGKKLEDYFGYYTLEIACRYFDAQHTLTAFTNRNQFAAEVEKILGFPQAIILSYLDQSKKTYDLSKSIFVSDNQPLISLTGLKLTVQLLLNGGFSSLHKMNEDFFHHPFLNKIFNRFATYNGSNPYKVPAVLSCIAALEHTIGAYFPKGGMSEIPNSIMELTKDLNVQYHLNSPVNQLLKKDDKWFVNNTVTQFDAVVYNGDIYQFPKLLKEKINIPAPSLKNSSTSALVFYWGINRRFSELNVHNIFFAENYKAEFTALEKGEVYLEDPTVYVHVSCKVEKNDAPQNKENWFVMVNVPAKQISETVQSQLRTVVLNKLSKFLEADISSLIEVESHYNPQQIAATTSSYNGALYGLNSNNIINILKRPKNKSHLKGLYHVGGTVFPGGGIPLCLSSAKIAAKEIQKDFKC